MNLFSTESTAFKFFYSATRQVDGLKLTLVSEDFTLKELDRLYASKSTGSEKIPARFVKEVASVLNSPIIHVVNFSIETGIVPKELKSARLVPIHKKK